MTILSITPQTQVLVLTGAGVSAESGVPTFRGMDGLWEGSRVEEVASPQGFAANPRLVWRFYSQRRQGALAVHPNPGHVALAKLEAKLGSRYLLATQNVDGLHARAGSKRLLAIHGELFESRCERCAVPFADTRTYFDELPKCEICGGRVRPHIVWFGETLDRSHLERISAFIEAAGPDFHFFAIGTSGMVSPAAGFVQAARAGGARTWLVDAAPSEEFASYFDEVIVGRSGVVLPVLLGG